MHSTNLKRFSWQSTCVHNNEHCYYHYIVYISIVYRVTKDSGREITIAHGINLSFFLLTLLDYFYHAWSKDLRSWSSKNKPEVFLFKMWLAVKRTDANAMWSLDVPILYGGNVQVNKTISHAWVSRQNVVLTYSRELASRLPFFVTIPLYTIVALWRICDFLYVAQLLSVIHRILLVYSERPLSVIVS